MALEELLVKASKRCEIFSNPLRTFLVSFIAVKGEATWTELKNAIESRSGPINPNTLSFHLGALTTAGYIQKIDIKGLPKYKVVREKQSEIKALVGEEALKTMEELFGAK